MIIFLLKECLHGFNPKLDFKSHKQASQSHDRREATKHLQNTT